MIRGDPDAVLWILGVPVEVYADEDLDASGSMEIYGVCSISPTEQLIRVDSRLSGPLLARTLQHEAFHAAFRLGGSSTMLDGQQPVTEELIIAPLEIAMTDLLGDTRNAWYVTIMTGGDAPWHESTETS